MLEKYYKEKIINRDYILLFKYGSFYEVFDNDAYILCNILKYKLVKIKDTFKCGFPVDKLSYVLDILCNMNISFIVIDNCVRNKRDFINNKYNDYMITDDIKYNISCINKIIKYLNDNFLNVDINRKLMDIEGIIDER